MRIMFLSDTVEAGDIIQVTNAENDWYPCLVIVEKVKNWGIQGYTSVPKGGDAYIRLEHSEFERVGRSALVAAWGDNTIKGETDEL